MILNCSRPTAKHDKGRLRRAGEQLRQRQADKAHRPSQPLSGPLQAAGRRCADRSARRTAPDAAESSRATDLPSTSRISASRRNARRQAPEHPDSTELRKRAAPHGDGQARAGNQKESKRYAKRPKRKYISANTQEYEFAAYMRAWVSAHPGASATSTIPTKPAANICT